MQNFYRKSKFLLPKEAFEYGNIEAAKYIPYRNFKVKGLEPKTEKQSKLYELMALSFMVTELDLYLDTHCDDLEAIGLFNEYIKKYDDLKVDYVSKFGPICLTMGDYMKDKFVWLHGWPWERENN